MELLLVTCSALPAGEPGGDLLLAACAERDVRARWVSWDDPGVDWAAGLVAVRATWDYDARRAEFLAWAASVPWLLNGADVFGWNTDKAYLAQLAGAGVPVVPTALAEDESDLPAAIAALGRCVIKPRVGAGGRGVVVVEPGDDLPELGGGPWAVQPLVESVRTEGEVSVFVLDGEVVAQARKLPAAGEIRVHEQYGGTTRAAEVDAEAAALAEKVGATTQELLGRPLDYARVDAMRLADGTLAVSELEATEPGLYLDVVPANAEHFADLVVRRFRSPALG